MNIGTLAARHARYRPGHLALVTESARLTWRELEDRIARFAAALQGIGVGPGDRIATVLPNGLAIYETYWAAARIGAATVPLSPLLRGDGRATLLRDSDASMVVADVSLAADLSKGRARLTMAPDRYVFCGGDGGFGRRLEDLTVKTGTVACPPAATAGPGDADPPFNIRTINGERRRWPPSSCAGSPP